LHKIKAAIFIITIVEPTGVPATMDKSNPIMAHTTERRQAKIVTFLKLLKICIDETAGKIIRAEIKRVPTRFMARTMIRAVTIAMTVL
jgi:hypothetical protein